MPDSFVEVGDRVQYVFFVSMIFGDDITVSRGATGEVRAVFLSGIYVVWDHDRYKLPRIVQETHIVLEGTSSANVR